MVPPNLLHASFVLGIGILIIMIVGSIYYGINWKKLKNKKIKVGKDELTFYRQYTHYGEYSNDEKIRKERIEKILDISKQNIDQSDLDVLVSSKFNGVYYAMYDLDSKENFDLFKDIHLSTSYAIFISSSDHYWGFIDIAYEKLDDIFFDINWKVCNDQKYVSFSRSKQDIFMRGLYEKMERKPRLSETNGELSKNFQLFIDKLTRYYNKEGLELSVLKYKDPNMLIKFNRKRKLQQLSDV